MKKISSICQKIFQNNAIRYWSKLERRSDQISSDHLRKIRAKARLLRNQLDGFIRKADARLALPLAGTNKFPRPHNSDWAWRPKLWRSALPIAGLSSVQTRTTFGQEVTLYHDCKFSELTLRQVRNLRAADLAPYGVRMDVFKFDGSYLSLAIDLPDSLNKGLLQTHLIRIKAIVEMEKPLEIFARLNIKNGPNTTQIIHELPLDCDEIVVEFDLYYSKIDLERLENAWIDLIFERPEMNQVTLRDVTISRRVRAAL